MAGIAKWISHNQGTFVSLILCLGIAIYTFGCESKVTSLVHENRMVTAGELGLEVEAEAARLEIELSQLLKRAELKNKEIERRDAIKQKLMDAALITSQAGKINPAGIVGLLFSVFGIGATIDNRIKDKVIKNRPLPKIEA
ncbi:MAG TPA: hypothetical protein VMY06_03230 [Sedimentisphaerales bacterium]|nr:hypothetical protein [Sedimentisphaerales bacterium]